ncbi:MAG: ATP-binding protein [Nitrospirales bacterium]|nr:GHKL domain-containing protein [Nitrospira sp.]MDR4501303.1 ATP-binding protein [Nitrospirales bacterium]
MLVHPPNRSVDLPRTLKGQRQTEKIVFQVVRTRSRREFLWGGLVVVLGGIALALDSTPNSSTVVGTIYALCVVLASRISYTSAAYVTAIICSILSLLPLANSDLTRLAWSDVTDRLLVLLAIWVAAFLSMLWDKPQYDNQQSVRGNQRRSTRPTLHAEVTTEQASVEPQPSLSANVDDLARLNDALLQKNYELETLINVVSHDLRSPLVNIQGFSKELDNSCARLREKIEHMPSHELPPAEIVQLLDEEIPEALRFIRAGSEKISSVLSGILQFSRLGRLSLNQSPLNLNIIVYGIATVMEFQLKEKGVLLQIDDLPDCLGDETLVSQVFSNLIENAYKYLDPARPGVIRISGKIQDEKSIYTVEDNGIGIHPDHEGKIFEMFHRLNPKEGGGEGLGLTIVRRIVERHQGNVWVESEFGHGTKFMVSFPSATTVHKAGKT